MTKKKTGIPGPVAAMLAAASEQAALLDPGTPNGEAEPVDEGGDEASSPHERDGYPLDLGVVEQCALLDHSDTDNAERLLAHFGADLLVLAQSKARKAAFAVWAGDHWDIDTGDPRALAIAQKLGGRIALEASMLKMSDDDRTLVDKAKAAEAKDAGELTAAERKMIEKAEKAVTEYRKRVQRRHSHAVSSKNKGRLEAMLACAAPHVMRGPEEFNSNPLKVAVKGHTLTFKTTTALTDNPAWGANGDDPTAPIDNRRKIEAKTADLIVKKGHDRRDLITQIVPVDYQPRAQCPLWTSFLEEMLPIDEVRRMVQVASGLGLVGLTVQKLFFHYGFGANGKSVYMETLTRLFGEIAVTLPSESFIGEGKGGGAANPDMARLYGRRFLRVKELPEGEDLRENLVKDLTGGEDFTVRDLFQGYFDFKPIFVGHMSGNGYPRITGTDNGIWRRMAVVHWPKTIAEKDQRPFEDVVSQFTPEYPGILNWLIDGVKIFLTEGLVVPDSVKAKTQEYRDEMDPTSAFCARCVVADPDAPPISAKDFYHAYVDFTTDQGGRSISLTKFGLIMKKKFTKEDGRTVTYHGVRLQEVPRPEKPSATCNDDYEAHLR